MNMRSKRPIRRAVPVAAVMLILGVAACGTEEDATKDRSAAVAARGQLPDPDREIPDPGVQSNGERAQIQEVVDDYQDSLLTLSGWGVCREISHAAERAVAGDGDCVGAYDRILSRGANPTTRRVRSKVVALDVDAARGIADVTLASPGRPQFHLLLREEEAEWRIPRVDLTDPTGLPAD